MGRLPQPETGSWLADVDERDVASHAVTFYDSEESLLELVTAFLAPAHRAGGAVVLLVTPQHGRLFADALFQAGVDVRDPRCAVLDTDAITDKVMTDGRLDRDAFRAVIQDALDAVIQPAQAIHPGQPDQPIQAAQPADDIQATRGTQITGATRPVRIYGELVSELWRLGHTLAAMEVEDVWNEVLDDRPGALLCGYPRDLFQRDPEGGPAAVSAKHGEVVRLDGPAPGRVPTPGSLPIDRRVFLAALAHDLQGPTAVVGGILDLLRLRRVEGNQEMSGDLLARATDGARRIQRLVSDIAALGHMDSGRFNYELAPFHLGEVVERTADDLAMISRRSIAVDIEPGLPPVLADRDRQAQILDNLLSNALKFSTSGQEVEVRLHRDGDWARVTVTDHGRGITVRDQRRIFDAFSRAESTAEIPGTGLGLFIVRLLVEGQGGRITVSSEPANGSAFTYTVPLAGTGER